MEIIYADPPWNYTSTGQSIPSRSKEGQPYRAMRMIDIYDFKLPDLADDCVLILTFGEWVVGREVILNFV